MDGYNRTYMVAIAGYSRHNGWLVGSMSFIYGQHKDAIQYFFKVWALVAGLIIVSVAVIVAIVIVVSWNEPWGLALGLFVAAGVVAAIVTSTDYY
jgi:hypothetical protein